MLILIVSLSTLTIIYIFGRDTKLNGSKMIPLIRRPFIRAANRPHRTAHTQESNS